MGISRMFTQHVTVSTYLGSGAHGDQYADPTSVSCYVEDLIREVRNQQGEQVVSTARVYAPITAASTTPPVAGQFAVGSQVTVNGRTAYVLSVSRLDGAGPTRAHHLEVALS